MATAQENTALITAKITGVTTRSKKLNNEIQEILNDISGHVLDHGDVTLYTKLYKDLKGVDKYALAKWIQMYGLATFKTDGSFSCNKKARKELPFDIGQGADLVTELTTNPPEAWYTLGHTSKDIKTALNVASSIKSLATRIKTASGDPDKIITFDFANAEAAMLELREAIAVARCEGQITEDKLQQAVAF